MSLRSARDSPFARLASEVGAWRGGSTAMRLAASAREDSTTEGYARHWREFEGWCDEEGLDPLPATPQMIFAYVGALAEKGTIAASSLQPYLSAINSYHADYGFDKPALGHLVTAARRGMARGQARCDTRDTRVPMPAAVAARILRATLAALPSLAARQGSRGAADFLRRRYAFVLSFVFMGRQDTSTGLRSADHGIDEDSSGFIWLRISEKMRRGWAFRRIVRLPLTAMSYHGHASLLPQLGELGRAYLAARAALGAAPEWLFQLPGERRPLTRHMAGWVSETLDEEGVRAPAGFVYLGHSLRAGGSSAAEAIRVPRFRGNWLGGWSQNGRTRELHYMDPSVLPSPEAYELLGWLLDGSYQALPPSWERRRGAADTAEPGEPTS